MTKEKHNQDMKPFKKNKHQQLNQNKKITSKLVSSFCTHWGFFIKVFSGMFDRAENRQTPCAVTETTIIK
jgi:hypothetical protein